MQAKFRPGHNSGLEKKQGKKQQAQRSPRVDPELFALHPYHRKRGTVRQKASQNHQFMELLRKVSTHYPGIACQTNVTTVTRRSVAFGDILGRVKGKPEGSALGLLKHR